MSQMTYEKFVGLVASLAEGRETRDIVSEIRLNYEYQLAEVTPYIVDNAITNVLRNIRRKTAKLVVDGADLFSGHDVPALTTRLITDEKGRKRTVNVRTEHLSKAELRARIDELRNRPPKRSKTLREYEALYEQIDNVCEDDETVETGLRRSRGY